MVLNLLLASSVAVTGMLLAADAGQDPSFDFNFATPKTKITTNQEATPAVAAPAYTQLPKSAQAETALVGQLSAPGSATSVLDVQTTDPTIAFAGQQNPNDRKPVSVSFHNAKASEVLSWLEKNNVSYIAADDSIGSKSISMNLHNVPLIEAVNGIAEALGGHWVRRGELRVFQKGGGSDVFSINSDRANLFGRGFATAPTIKLYDGNAYSLPNQRTFTWSKSGSGKSFIDSLTSTQKALQKSRGYLLFSDLTPAQKLGLNLHQPGANEDFTVKIKVDNQEVEIRNK